jgi:O-antigen/teichoic acid export membrane protein
VQLALRLTLGAVAAGCALALTILLRYPPVVVACMTVGCLWIVLSVISSTLGDVLQGLEMFGNYSAIALVAGITVTVGSTAAVALGCGPVGLSIAYLSAPVVTSTLYWRSLKGRVDIRLSWDAARVRALVRDARLAGLNQVASTARDRAEQLLVPRMVGLAPFGLFSAGAMIGDRLGNVPDAICTAFYPRMSRLAQEEDRHSLSATVATMLSISLAVSLPLAIAGTYLADGLASVLLPGQQDACRAVIRVTVWAVPIAALSVGMSCALQAAGRHEYVARAALSSTVVSAVATVLSIGIFGVVGASYAVVFRPAALAVALLPAFRLTFPAVPGRVPYARITASAVLLASFLLMGEPTLLWRSVLLVTVGVSAYGLALLLCGVFSIQAVAALLAPAVQDVATHAES